MEELNLGNQPSGQQTLSSMFDCHETYPMKGHHASTLTDAVTDYIVMDMVPISVVKREGFHNMLNKFDPRYIKCPDALTSLTR